MRTFKDIKKEQYIYRVRLSDYSIQKIQVFTHQNSDVMCGNQLYLRTEPVRDVSYFAKDIFGYATCKQALKELLQEQSSKALQALQSLNLSFVYRDIS